MTNEYDEQDGDSADEPEEALAEAYNLGLKREKSGDVDGAEHAYLEALKIDPSDPGGVTIRLAALGRLPSPERMPDAYIAMLFDQHADAFDDILVDRLGYSVPLLVHQTLVRLGLGPFQRMLDLGCGTGLSGIALTGMTDHRTGVDLSERIVELAFDRGVYDDLYVGEAVEFLADFEEEDGSRPSWDLIVATDVFPYLGAAEPFIENAARRLTGKGVLAFSTESLPEDVPEGKGYAVGPKRRFAHGETYLRATLTAAGFEVLDMEPITVRMEEEEPVPGHLVTARLGGNTNRQE